MKEAVKIPVIGNGDIDSPQKAKQMLDKYGVDGIMIGRAALGNPWMLYRTVKYLEEGVLYPEPTPKERIDICALNLDRLIALKGEKVAVQEMRKHAAWYIKGIRGAAAVRTKINQAETREELLDILYQFVQPLEAEKEAI